MENSIYKYIESIEEILDSMEYEIKNSYSDPKLNDLSDLEHNMSKCSETPLIFNGAPAPLKIKGVSEHEKNALTICCFEVMCSIFSYPLKTK